MSCHRTIAPLFFLFTGLASATVIASNFGPVDPVVSGGQSIGSFSFCPGGSLFCQAEIAMPFTPDQDFTFDTVRVAAAHGFGLDASKGNQLTVYLAKGSSEPGLPIETFTFSGLPDFPTRSIVTGASVLHPRLSAGVQYWVVVTTSDLVANAMVWFSGESAPAVYVRATGYPSWTRFTPAQMQPTAFDVSGTPVPEPGTMLGFGMGVSLLWLIGSRRP